MKTNAKPAQKPSVKKAGFRHRKRILVIVILLVIAAAAAVFLFRLRSQNADVSRITTYNVEEITYGNVSTTVSGSGTLTSVTSETLTASAAGEVQSVNFSVGDEVAPGGSVAMVMGKDGFTMGIAVDELNISSIALGGRRLYRVCHGNLLQRLFQQWLYGIPDHRGSRVYRRSLPGNERFG